MAEQQDQSNRIAQLEARLKKLEQGYAIHQHNNSDGTIQLRKNMVLDQDQIYVTGSTERGSEALYNPTNKRQFFGVSATGPQMQQTTTHRFPNTQIVTRNLPDFGVAVVETIPTGSVNTGTEKVTVAFAYPTDTIFYYQDNGGTTLAGLVDETYYYVKFSDATHIQISATPGGVAINLTGTGNSAQTFTYFPNQLGKADAFYGQGNPIVTIFPSMIGTIDFNVATSVVTIPNYNFAINELVGAYIIVYDSNFVAVEIQPIISNTATVISINGAWWNDTQNGSFEIFSPVFLGDYNHPWYQLALIDGEPPNGIRFGGGIASSGSNTPWGYLSAAGGPQQLSYTNSAGTVQLSIGIGVTDSFTTADLKTVQVINGIISSIV